MSDEFRQLLVRIDERTSNIEARQSEEISERKALDVRVNALESWRNFIVGGLTAITFFFAAGIEFGQRKINGH